MSTKPFCHIVTLFVLGLFILAPVYASGTGQEQVYPPSDTSEIVPELVVYGVEPAEGPSGIEATVIVEGFGEDVAVYFGECEADVLARPSYEEIVVRVPEWCYPEAWDDTEGEDEEWEDVEGEDEEWDDDEFEPEGFDKWSGENGCVDEEPPSGWEHTVSVTVMDFDTDLSATKSHAFTYLLDVQPAVENVEPCSGPPGILAELTIRGFGEAVAVYFGQCAAPIVERRSLDEIVVEVPACVSGSPSPTDECLLKAESLSTDDCESEEWNYCHDDTCGGMTVAVSVIDLDTGAWAAKHGAFTYEVDLVPIVEKVEPDKGTPGMLTTITVCGFSEAVSVYFGESAALVVDRPSLDQIIVEVPPCWLDHPGEHQTSTAAVSSMVCNDGEMDGQQDSSGESSWHKESVTVVDLQTGAYAIAPHAFNYLCQPYWADPAVGVLVVRDIELRQGDIDVQIPIMLDYHSAATDGVSTIMFALAYDPDKFAITDVAVGEAAASAGKSVNWNVGDNGLLSIAVDDGQEEIPQGEVCVLHGSIPADASRGIKTRLEIEELSAASPEGAEMVLDIRHGTVRVGMSYDINDDWTVDAVDVQLVINVALYAAPRGPEEMTMADGDEDGDVDAVDIQQTINRVLMLF